MATHKVLLNVSVNTLCVAFSVLKHKKAPLSRKMLELEAMRKRERRSRSLYVNLTMNRGLYLINPGYAQVFHLGNISSCLSMKKYD